MVKEIPLTKGRIAIVDDEDYPEISKYKWHFSTSGYAVRSVWDGKKKKKTMLLMHRVLTGASRGEVVDHINGNKLDNRKSNLRICMQHQNMANRSTQTQSNNKSGYRGVSWSVANCGWESAISSNYKKYYLGIFDNPHDAARMYNFWAVDLFGEFARLNVIKEEIA